VSRLRLLRIGILVGLLLAFALRFYRLGHQNLWWDEGLSILSTRQSFVDATLWTAGDVHPPLYFWTLWLWSQITGETEFALRAITALFSCLTVALMYPFGRRLGGRGVGLAAVILLALSRFHIWWAQEMRMYTLAGLCIALSSYLLLRLLTRPLKALSWKAWGVWVLATLGALYTIYAAVTLLLIQNLIVLGVGLARKNDRWGLWWQWAVAQGAVAVGMAPWLALALPRMHSWSVVQEPASLGFVMQLDAVLLTLGISTEIGRYVWPIAGWLALIGIGMVCLIYRRRSGTVVPLGLGLAVVVLGVLAPPVVIWFLTQPRALFYTPRVEARYLVPWGPFFALWVAWAWNGWMREKFLRIPGLLAGMAILGGMIWVLPQYYEPRYLHDDLQTLTRTIWAYARPGDAVWLVSGDRYPVFLSYYDRPEAPLNRPAVEFLPHAGTMTSPETLAADLQSVASGRSRIWLAQVESGLQDPDGWVERWVSSQYTPAMRLGVGYNQLTLYIPRSSPVWQPTTDQMPPMLQGAVLPGVLFLGYDLATDEFRSGDRVRFNLYVRATAPVTLTVRMVGEKGEAGRILLPLKAGMEVLRLPVEFGITPYMPAGSYHMGISADSDVEIAMGKLQVTHTEVSPDPESIPVPMLAQVGESIRFLGYGLHGVKGQNPPEIYPGETLRLDLYWESPEPLDEHFTVFTHLVGTAYNPATGGPLWAQLDQEPVGGTYPTTDWLPDLPLRDSYELLIPADAPPGDYQLEVGMYRPMTGERLPVSGRGADFEARRLLLPVIRVVARP